MTTTEDIDIEATVGPRVPNDDGASDDKDDDGDDDAAASAADDGKCECRMCRPKPLPRDNDELIEALNRVAVSAIAGMEQAGEYGAEVTKELVARPLPAEYEAIVLQHCVDIWNADDRFVVAIAEALVKISPAHAETVGGKTMTGEPRTLDDALRILADTRRDRPRERGHEVKGMLRNLLDGLESGTVRVESVEVVE